MYQRCPHSCNVRCSSPSTSRLPVDAHACCRCPVPRRSASRPSEWSAATTTQRSAISGPRPQSAIKTPRRCAGMPPGAARGHQQLRSGLGAPGCAHLPTKLRRVHHCVHRQGRVMPRLGHDRRVHSRGIEEFHGTSLLCQPRPTAHMSHAPRLQQAKTCPSSCGLCHDLEKLGATKDEL